MQLRITCDINAESGIDEVIYEIAGPTSNQFTLKNYGTGLKGVGIVLMCRNPELEFKQRIRFDKKELIIYMDIMFNLHEMSKMDHKNRKIVIARKLIDEIPVIVGKYKIVNFDTQRFLEDLKIWWSSKLVAE